MSAEQEFICTEVKLIDDGKSIEATFVSTRSKITRMTACYSAEHWLRGSWAEFKLAEFRESLSETIKILEGRK